MTRGEKLQFGERLRRRRDSLGLTQEQVAEEIGISTRYYQMIECGDTCGSVDTLVSASKILNISIDYLLFGDSVYSPDNPFLEVANGLSNSRREDALTILRLYAKACKP